MKKKTERFPAMLLAATLVVGVPVNACADGSELSLPGEEDFALMMTAEVPAEQPSELFEVPAEPEAAQALEEPSAEASVLTEAESEAKDSAEEPVQPEKEEEKAEEVQALAVMDDGEPLLGTAPPMDKEKVPKYTQTWLDLIIPEFGKQVGQYEVQEGQFYVLQTVITVGFSHHMTKTLVYVDRVYEAPGILWGTNRTIDYTDVKTGEHKTQNIGGWTPESVILFEPEEDRVQNMLPDFLL